MGMIPGDAPPLRLLQRRERSASVGTRSESPFRNCKGLNLSAASLPGSCSGSGETTPRGTEVSESPERNVQLRPIRASTPSPVNEAPERRLSVNTRRRSSATSLLPVPSDAVAVSESFETLLAHVQRLLKWANTIVPRIAGSGILAALAVANLCSRALDGRHRLLQLGYYVAGAAASGRASERGAIVLCMVCSVWHAVQGMAIARRLVRSQTELVKQISTMREKSERSEKLLKLVFPSEHVHSMLGGYIPEPTRHYATVMFCDIVGYTDITHAMDPLDVATMLRRIYREFDRICQRRSLRKVETVGDAFVIVGGMPFSTPGRISVDHGDAPSPHTPSSRRTPTSVAGRHVGAQSPEVAVVLAALEFIELAATLELPELASQSSPHVRLRIGIQSGEIAAGVSDGAIPQFKIFGDTVNAAARMQTAALEGTVQICRATFDEFSEQCKRDMQVSKLGVEFIRRVFFSKGRGDTEAFAVGSIQSDRAKRTYIDTHRRVSCWRADAAIPRSPSVFTPLSPVAQSLLTLHRSHTDDGEIFLPTM